MQKQRTGLSCDTQQPRISRWRSWALSQAPISGPERFCYVICGALCILGGSAFQGDPEAWPLPAGFLLAFAMMFELTIAFSLWREHLDGNNHILPKALVAIIVPVLALGIGLVVSAVSYG